MKYGVDEEPKAREAYTLATGNNVLETGLWVNRQHPHLGASPDGLILSDTGDAIGVLEIKCLKMLKETSVADLIKEVEDGQMDGQKSRRLSMQCFKVHDGKLVLKETHDYYYQVQLQMLVTGFPFCDFVLYSKEGPPSIQRIERDVFFHEKIARNLTLFWERVLAPEYFEARIPRNLPVFIL